MVKNQCVFRVLSSIAFATVKSQREEKQKKYDFETIFFISNFSNFWKFRNRF